MKQPGNLIGQFVVMTVVLILILTGCRLAREPVRQRDDFFKPVIMLPKRAQPVPSPKDLNQAKQPSVPAATGTAGGRDSLASLQRPSDSLSISKNSRIDTVSDMQSKGLQRETSSPALQHSAATPSILNEYTEGLSLFKVQQYSEALSIFSRLLEKGIEQDIADNCEYWIGECHFARQEFADAVIHFQNVLSIDSSNKKIDAFFMLGKTYEHTGDTEKALAVYEELNERYPQNAHAKAARYRLNVLTRARSNDR